MNNNSLLFLMKVVNVRKALIKSGHSKQNTLRMIQLMHPINEWLEFWGDKITEEGALCMIWKHKHAIEELIPGGYKGCGPKLRVEFNTLIQKYHAYVQFKKNNPGTTERSLQLFLRSGRIESSSSAEQRTPND